MDTLLTFRNEESGCDVIVYTDSSYVDQEGTVRVYAARYVIQNDGSMELHEIESRREWDIVQELLDEIQEEMEEII